MKDANALMNERHEEEPMGILGDIKRLAVSVVRANEQAAKAVAERSRCVAEELEKLEERNRARLADGEAMLRLYESMRGEMTPEDREQFLVGILKGVQRIADASRAELRAIAQQAASDSGAAKRNDEEG